LLFIGIVKGIGIGAIRASLSGTGAATRIGQGITHKEEKLHDNDDHKNHPGFKGPDRHGAGDEKLAVKKVGRQNSFGEQVFGKGIA
jgi:hypothetical protein